MTTPANPSPKRTDEITVYEEGEVIHTLVHTVTADDRIFAQPTTSKGRVLNRYYKLADEGSTWARGRLDETAARAMVAAGALLRSR